MQTIQEVERAIEALSPHDLEELHEWMDERFPQPIDAQLKTGLEEGRMDARIRRAIAGHHR